MLSKLAAIRDQTVVPKRRYRNSLNELCYGAAHFTGVARVGGDEPLGERSCKRAKKNYKDREDSAESDPDLEEDSKVAAYAEPYTQKITRRVWTDSDSGRTITVIIKGPMHPKRKEIEDEKEIQEAADILDTAIAEVLSLNQSASSQIDKATANVSKHIEAVRPKRSHYTLLDLANFACMEIPNWFETPSSQE